MSNNNHQNFSCGFAEELVGYLYNELSSDQQIKFEKHLDTCQICLDELAGFGVVRSSISDWFDGDFAKLKTPQIEIPYQTIEKTVLPVREVSISWLERLRQIFAQTPVWATASTGFAVLAACFGLTMFIFNYSTSDDLAEAKRDVQVTPEVSVRPPKPLPVEIPAEKTPEKTTETADLPALQKPETVVQPNQFKSRKPDQIKEPDKQIRINNKPDNTTMAGDNRNQPNRTNPATTNVEQVPRLSNLTEDTEDDSLRLADLFDEVGSKK